MDYALADLRLAVKLSSWGFFSYLSLPGAAEFIISRLYKVFESLSVFGPAFRTAYAVYPQFYFFYTQIGQKIVGQADDFCIGQHVGSSEHFYAELVEMSQAA